MNKGYSIFIGGNRVNELEKWKKVAEIRWRINNQLTEQNQRLKEQIKELKKQINELNKQMRRMKPMDADEWIAKKYHSVNPHLWE